MLLVISPFEEDHASIRNAIPASDCPVCVAPTAHEGLALLRRQSARVVITERDLPDGNWRQVLDALQSLAQAPLLIVTSRHADERLWAEVLNLGGYDVLSKPFDQQELARVLYLACARPKYYVSSATDGWALTYG
jgi:DNA-binding response OmpR family regulator